MQPVGSVLVGKRGAPSGLYPGRGTISDVLPGRELHAQRGASSLLNSPEP